MYIRKHTSVKPVESAESIKAYREEMERAAASKREYMLTEEERLEIISKYGPPKGPHDRTSKVIHINPKRKGNPA